MIRGTVSIVALVVAGYVVYVAPEVAAVWTRDAAGFAAHVLQQLFVALDSLIQHG